MHVPVSIVDLLATAAHLGESVSTNYENNFCLGVFTNGAKEWIRTVSLRLRKPCPFLRNDLCSVYPVRPLPCILFPEELVLEGSLQASAREEHFRDYLCIHGPLVLSAERAEAVASLQGMWHREDLVSSLFLFGYSPCYIDFSTIRRELRPPAGNPKEATAENRHAIWNHALERFFLERFSCCQPFAGAVERIRGLEDPSGREQFLQSFRDDRLVQKLKRAPDERAHVFRFTRGKLKVKRRSLTPSEYKYPW
ncbi:MAG: YkgJ family cysteine cluster protein [Syntrophobacteria bacterium]